MSASEELRRVGEEEVRRVLRELPKEVAEPMSRCAVRLLGTIEEWGGETGTEEEELLGLFEGAPWNEADEAGEGPPCITLFVESIWEEAGRDLDRFREEVRVTLLHEIGHYLGWDEDEVEERGLG
ncbi:MAG: metallopeptidase family protein [Verrucomicrobiia bacterium]